MAESLVPVTLVVRWLLGLLRFLPDRLIRWAFPKAKFLARIELFHFSQTAWYQDYGGTSTPELQGLGFNLFNFTPYAFAIVGADIRATLDSQSLFHYEQRFAAETPVKPYVRSGFYIRQTLSDASAARVRASKSAWARLQLSGYVILRTPFGEQRKEVNADVIVILERFPAQSGM